MGRRMHDKTQIRFYFVLKILDSNGVGAVYCKIWNVEKASNMLVAY
jgi:hypothetical protein